MTQLSRRRFLVYLATGAGAVTAASVAIQWGLRDGLTVAQSPTETPQLEDENVPSEAVAQSNPIPFMSWGQSNLTFHKLNLPFEQINP